MEQDFNEKHWASPCPKYDCRKDNCKCGLKFVSIPAVLGDDSSSSEVAPRNGLYCNAIVRYEANGNVYVYSKEGIPVLVEGYVFQEEPIPIRMINITDATWDLMGHAGKSTLLDNAGYVRFSASSSDVQFKKEDGTILTVRDLYTAISRGEVFRLNVPYMDIAQKILDDNRLQHIATMGTREGLIIGKDFSIQKSPFSDKDIYVWPSSVLIRSSQYGFVFHDAPFGLMHDEEYWFMITIFGAESFN